MSEAKIKVVATFHEKQYTANLPHDATMADIRQFVGNTVKQNLDEEHYWVTCAGQRISEEDRVVDIGYYSYEIIPADVSAPVKKGARDALKPEEELALIGQKRGRVSELVKATLDRIRNTANRNPVMDTTVPGPSSSAKLLEDKKATSKLGGGLAEGLDADDRRREEIKRDAVTFRFVIGSVATATNQRDEVYPAETVHKWCMYVRGMKNEDLSNIIESVQWTLHETFKARRIQNIKKPPFEIHEKGWGQFEYEVVIKFQHIPTPMKFTALLAFGRPKQLPHCIPPNPTTRVEPLGFPMIPKDKKPHVHERIEEVVFLKSPEALKSAVRVSGGPSATKGVSVWADIKAFGEPVDEEADYQNLCKIRDDLRAEVRKLQRRVEAAMCTQEQFAKLMA